MKHLFTALALSCVLLSGCAVIDQIEKQQARAQEDRELAVLRNLALAEHSAFRSAAGWRADTYRNEKLLAAANPENVSIQIGLGDQRGLLLVKGAIAMDFPVATGRKSHPTPAGDFKIRAKKKDYASNLYGKIYDMHGLIVVQDADIRTDAIPEDGWFEGALMPYWMRLTDTGVGMHVGYVPGRPASHGCIRLRQKTAGTLFELVKVGTPVTIANVAPALEAKPTKKSR